MYRIGLARFCGVMILLCLFLS